MKIGFTGTREGMTSQQHRELVMLLNKLTPSEFHHGDCKGADAQAHLIARELNLLIVGHPTLNTRLRAFSRGFQALRQPKEYLERDRDIVDETELLIACPKESAEQQRSGTWYTVRYARRQAKRVYIIHPDGFVGIDDRR